jgi:small conductance mechanosensitive channel
MNLDFNSAWEFLTTQGVDIGLKVAGAVVAWMIGRWLIGLASRLIQRGLNRSGRLDVTLSTYIVSVISILLTVVLILAILGIFGVQTTSFAALLAGLGLAIGTAWGGLLTHFAAGVFLQFLRPFQVGDFITAGGVMGTVKELGLFATTIVTMDNVTTIVGNNKILSDNIQNFSSLPVRRVDCVTKVANGVEVEAAIRLLRQAVSQIPHVAEQPAPEIEVLQFTPEGPLLCVRPYTHNDHYWQVYFDTHAAIIKTFGEAGFPVPETPMAYRTVAAQ